MITNTCMFLLEGRVRDSHVLEYGFNITEDIHWVFNWYTEHPLLVMYGLYLLDGCLHCNELTTKRACFDGILPFAEPYNWGMIQKQQ